MPSAFVRLTTVLFSPTFYHKFGGSLSTFVFKLAGIILYNQKKKGWLAPMLDSVIVGNVFREIRERKGLSQEVVSGLADIGRTHLSAIERGERRPTLDTLFKLAAALNMPASEIVREMEAALKRSEEKGSGIENYFK